MCADKDPTCLETVAARLASDGKSLTGEGSIYKANLRQTPNPFLLSEIVAHFRERPDNVTVDINPNCTIEDRHVVFVVGPQNSLVNYDGIRHPPDHRAEAKSDVLDVGFRCAQMASGISRAAYQIGDVCGPLPLINVVREHYSASGPARLLKQVVQMDQHIHNARGEQGAISPLFGQNPGTKNLLNVTDRARNCRSFVRAHTIDRNRRHYHPSRFGVRTQTTRVSFGIVASLRSLDSEGLPAMGGEVR